MRGLMQDWKLVVPGILDHAAENHGTQEVVTRGIEGPIRRTTYADIHSRARKVAKALTKDGVARGDRVGTLALNTERHLEVWYGIMGAGAVCHTLNPRLFPQQLVYIINHAEDRIIFTDAPFLPILEGLAPHTPSVKSVVVLTDRTNMPESKVLNLVCYEDWISGVDDRFDWVDVEENDACGLCYTSGTTGNPKGVLYSHRSNVIHGIIGNSSDCFGLSATDTMLPVVPMFHANAWGLAFGAPMAGAKLVMPGIRLDGASVYELLESEKVTCSGAVPTVWSMLLDYLEKSGSKLSTLKTVVIGGSACPRSMIETFADKYGVEVLHAWGMTEMSPMGTLARPKPGFEMLDREAKIAIRLKQGRTPYGVAMKLVDDDGNDLPRDGKTPGRLLVKGPSVAKSYFKEEKDALEPGGWFDTGDVATIDADGFMQITDRAKDLIKSGGEWISSIDLENAAVGHPDVMEAAVIGVKHPKWEERPLLVVVPKEGANLTREAMIDYLADKVAKWWLPDDVVFVPEIPHTATGKISKKDLRVRFREHLLSSAAE